MTTIGKVLRKPPTTAAGRQRRPSLRFNFETLKPQIQYSWPGTRHPVLRAALNWVPHGVHLRHVVLLPPERLLVALAGRCHTRTLLEVNTHRPMTTL